MSKTMQNLREAFAGESMANRKYLAFARQAEKEGHPQVARLFRAAAEAETIHAHNHLRAMGGVRSTTENLKEAIAGEVHEFTDMYPPMIEDARAEGNKAAERVLSYANEVEKTHEALYRKALENLGNLRETVYQVCAVCGHTHEGGEPPDRCPVCGANANAFFQVD
ncbi:MAG: rubrerythrin family protein [Thermodesulfobacteriota bacterium]